MLLAVPEMKVSTVINNFQKHLQKFAQTSCGANNKAKRMI